MGNPMRRPILSISAVVGAAVLIGVILPIALADEGDETADTGVLAGVSPTAVGDELALSLGLSPQPWPVPGGCALYAESTDGTGYCLDGVTTGLTSTDAWALGVRVTGRIPSETDRQLFECTHRLDDMEHASVAMDAPEYLAVVQTCHELLIKSTEEDAATGVTGTTGTTG